VQIPRRLDAQARCEDPTALETLGCIHQALRTTTRDEDGHRVGFKLQSLLDCSNRAEEVRSSGGTYVDVRVSQTLTRARAPGGSANPPTYHEAVNSVTRVKRHAFGAPHLGTEL